VTTQQPAGSGPNGEPAVPTRSSNGTPRARLLSTLSDKTLLPFGFVLVLLGGAYAFGQSTKGSEQDRLEWREFQSRSLQRDAELRKADVDLEARLERYVTIDQWNAREIEYRAFVNLMRAKLPKELQDAIPPWPR
jgi:hypothetical protein